MHHNDPNDRFFCMQTTRIHSQPCAVSILFLCFCVLFIDKQKGENELMRDRETDKKWHYSFRSSLEEELCALFSVSFINQIATFRLKTKAMATERWWRSDSYLVNTNKLSICFDLTPIIIIIIVDRIGDTRSGLSECVIIISDSIQNGIANRIQ